MNKIVRCHMCVCVCVCVCVCACQGQALSLMDMSDEWGAAEGMSPMDNVFSTMDQVRGDPSRLSSCSRNYTSW